MANPLISKILLNTPLVDPRTGKVIAQPWIYFFLSLFSSLGSSNNPTGGMLNFADQIVPTGAINGVNATFVLPNTPNPPSSCNCFLSGKKLTQGIGYMLVGNVVTMAAGYIPNAAGGGLIADTLEFSYRF